ncbi:MAG: hypothetical protein Q7S53_04920 [bacterium]|nr:hypothetical protein [bacterium]
MFILKETLKAASIWAVIFMGIIISAYCFRNVPYETFWNFMDYVAAFLAILCAVVITLSVLAYRRSRTRNKGVI